MKHYEELNMLLKQHFGNKQVIGIEIGTGGGAATVTILNALPNCFLYTIDPFEHREGEEFEASHPQEEHDRTREQAEKRLSNFSNRSKLLAMKSKDAINFVPKEVDFVHVDGDHSEIGINTDIDLYSPLVKKDGIFSGHDYGQVAFVTNAVDKKWGDRVHTGGDFTFWVFV